jgi:anti-sigma B factor antagonist
VTTRDQEVRWSGRHAIAALPAEIDVTNSADVASLLAAVVAQLPDVLTADMTGTTFCDSSGIHALARAHRLAAANGCELRLAIGDSPARRILELTGLNQVVPVFANVEQSLAAVRGPDPHSGD